MPQRSPVNFWLLLAATLCVDVATAAWVFWGDLGEESAAPFLALAFSQLGILCVWVVFVTRRIRFSWVAPLFLGIAVAAIVALSAPNSAPKDESWEAFIAFIVLTWTHVAIVLPILWLLKPTRVGAAFANLGTTPRWQFSMMHLLTVMTCLAILCVLLRQSEWARREMVVFVTLPIANVLLLLLVIVAVQIERHWLLRLALSLGGALVIAAVSESSGAEIADGLNFYVFSLIQAFVLWAWLEVLRPVQQADVELVTPPIESTTQSR